MDQLTRRGAGGIEADHATVFRWVVRFTPLFAEAARPGRHTPGGRWFVDETYVKVLGRWRYLYRAVDQFGQVIDVLVSPKRDQKAARRFFTRALAELHPAGRSNQRPGPPPTPRCSTSSCPPPSTSPCPTRTTGSQADHGRLKARLRPMRGLKRDRSLRIVATGHAFVQNLRRGYYELATEAAVPDRVVAAFTQVALAV